MFRKRPKVIWDNTWQKVWGGGINLCQAIPPHFFNNSGGGGDYIPTH